MARSELVYAELWELVKSLLPDRAYSPKCLEGVFSEVRCLAHSWRSLGSSSARSKDGVPYRRPSHSRQRHEKLPK
jgi:hypothetical protein